MTNKEAAAHFAALPADGPAEILVINGDYGAAEILVIDEPGTNIEKIEIEEEDERKMATVYREL